MSKKKQCGHSGSCGCQDKAFTTIPSYSCPPDENCPNPEPCSEFYDSSCIQYTGPEIVDVPILTGERLSSIVQKLVILSTNPGCISGGTCASVTTLAITNVTNTSISAGWGLVTGTVNYQIEYKLASSGTWILGTLLGPTINFDTITGLIPEETYHIRVNAICTVGNCYSVTLLVKTLT